MLNSKVLVWIFKDLLEVAAFMKSSNMWMGKRGSRSSLKNDLRTPAMEFMEFPSANSDKGSLPEKTGDIINPMII